FFSANHSWAISGYKVCNDVDGVAILPAQAGQPLPNPARLAIVALHSCVGSLRQRHQTFFPLPGLTSSGLRSKFLVGCHSLTSCEFNAFKEVVDVAFFPAQNGQPLPLVRTLIKVSHSWVGFLRQSHHTFLWLFDVT